MIQARLGQGQFRTSLIDYWGACAVSGCKNLDVLRASHIKPWRVCADEDRLNPFNGLLLAANIDVAFDAGLATFEISGAILFSPELSNSDRSALGLRADMPLSQVDEAHHCYLLFHQKHVFRGERDAA